MNGPRLNNRAGVGAGCAVLFAFDVLGPPPLIQVVR
jgi:hypothetical protein